MPDSNQFVSNPLLDGDTWHIRIKGTDDVLPSKTKAAFMVRFPNFSLTAMPHTARVS